MIGLEGAKGVGLWKRSHIFTFRRPAFQSALRSLKRDKKWEKYESLLLLQKEASEVKRDLGQARSCGRAWTGLGPPTLTAGPPNQK